MATDLGQNAPPGHRRLWFTTTNGDLSMARLQIAWGALLLANYSFLSLVRFAGPPTAVLVESVVIFFVGGVALILEARIERLPDLASWSGPLPTQNGATLQVRYWHDIAVLQLGLGAVVIPMLSCFPASATIGWRLITITIVSELVYLAFLSALLVQKDELNTLFVAIQQAKQRIEAAAGSSDSFSTQERLTREKAEQAKLDLLQHRAAVLMQRIGRTSMTVKPSN